MGRPFIGIQIGAVSFVDEGVANVLDEVQKRASVNALLIANHTFDRGTGGRQIPGHPFPDHGVQEYDYDFVGGAFNKINAQFYTTTSIKEFRAPDHGEYDVFDDVLPEAKKRGMKVYAWINENPYAPIPRIVPNFPKVLEMDPYGRRVKTPCLNNPDYRHWLYSFIEDYIKSYPLDGIAWCSERQGPLGNLIGGGWNINSATCFCPNCWERALKLGLNPSRAVQGYKLLIEFFEESREGKRPNDGYFVTFWRLLLEYPEILGWHRLWTDSLMEVYAEIFGIVKAINPEIQVGWHIMHLLSFSPFFRADQDYARLRRFSDFIKVVTYHNCAGFRFQRFVETLCQTIFRDTTPERLVPLLYDVLGYAGEARFDELHLTGFSADYIRRETERAIKGTGGSVAIYPGIDVDIPTPEGTRKMTPEDVKQGVIGAFRGGAHGIILSRKYSEMKLANLDGVNAALRELNIDPARKTAG